MEVIAENGGVVEGGMKPFGLINATTGAPIPARDVAVRVDTVETTAHLTVTGNFHTVEEVAKAEFRCPLDDTRSAVVGLTLRSASRGEVKSTVTVKPGNRGGRSERSRLSRRWAGRDGDGGNTGGNERDVFSLEVGELAANEDVHITMRAVIELAVDDRTVLLTLPAPMSFPRCLRAFDDMGGDDKGPEDVARGEEDAVPPPSSSSAQAAAAAGVPATRVTADVVFHTPVVGAAVKCTTHPDAVVTTTTAAAAVAARTATAPGGGDESKTAGDAVAAPPSLTTHHVRWSGGVDGMGGNLVVEATMPQHWVPAAIVEKDATTGTASVSLPIIPRPAPTGKHDGKDGKAGGEVATATATPAPQASGGLFSGVMNFFGKRNPRKTAITSQVVFVLDRSGSMVGTKFEAVQQCMAELLAVLPPSAAFDVVSFGSTFKCMFDECRPALPGDVETALGNIRGMSANMGGTNLVSPLQHVYSTLPPRVTDGKKAAPTKKSGYKLRKDIPLSVICLTDGCVDNRPATIALVREHAHASRCFTFGIGRDVDVALVKGMAMAGHGRCSFVGNSDKLRKQAARRLAKALSATWYGVDVAWDATTGAAPEGMAQAPRLIPPTFHGEATNVYLTGPNFGILSDGRANVSATYKCDGTQGQLTAPVVRLPPGVLPALTVATLAARGMIKDFDMSGDIDTAEGAEAVKALSLKYGLTSKYTGITMPLTEAAQAAADLAKKQAEEARAKAQAEAEAARGAAGGGRQGRRRRRNRMRAQARNFDDYDSSSSSASDDDDEDDDMDVMDGMAGALGAPPTAAPSSYTACYRAASDSSSGSDVEMETGESRVRSSAMRTTTWQPRAAASSAVTWNGRGGGLGGGRRGGGVMLGSSSSDSDDGTMVPRAGAGAGAGAGGRVPWGARRARMSPLLAGISDPDSDDDGSDVSVVSASSAHSAPRTRIRFADAVVGNGTPAAITPAVGAAAGPQPDTVVQLQNGDGSFSATPFLAKALGLGTRSGGATTFNAAVLDNAQCKVASAADPATQSVFATALVVAILSKATPRCAAVDAALARARTWLAGVSAGANPRFGNLLWFVQQVLGGWGLGDAETKKYVVDSGSDSGSGSEDDTAKGYVGVSIRADTSGEIVVAIGSS